MRSFEGRADGELLQELVDVDWHLAPLLAGNIFGDNGAQSKGLASIPSNRNGWVVFNQTSIAVRIPETLGLNQEWLSASEP
jgi:hypothetical protein